MTRHRPPEGGGGEAAGGGWQVVRLKRRAAKHEGEQQTIHPYRICIAHLNLMG